MYTCYVYIESGSERATASEAREYMYEYTENICEYKKAFPIKYEIWQRKIYIHTKDYQEMMKGRQKGKKYVKIMKKMMFFLYIYSAAKVYCTSFAQPKNSLTNEKAKRKKIREYVL